MRKVDALLSEYGESHQTKLNKIIHYFCVPAIVFSVIGLLAAIPTPSVITDLFPENLQSYVHFGTIALVFTLLYYLSLSVLLFFAMLIYSAFVLVGINLVNDANFMPLWAFMLLIFVIAWIVQFYGHNHEGKKPSFLKDIQFLLIGPAWTTSHLFDAFGIKF
jgi:uncharacterized membrane protein YGL010W